MQKEATLVSLKLRVLERKYILGYMLHFPPMYLYIIMYIFAPPLAENAAFSLVDN